MCLVLLAYRVHPSYPLVVAANRDEFFRRPTRQAAFWSVAPGNPGLLAGQDLSHGGTWLGLSRQGRFAAITNIRDPARSAGARSRGALTRDYLLAEEDADHYLDRLAGSLADYGGFNLLLADRDRLFCLHSLEGRPRELGPGIHGFSNGGPDSDWHKVAEGKRLLARLVENATSLDTDSLLALMADSDPAPDHQLPSTGLPLELERLLSARFIVNPARDYGTRCSTAIVLDQQGGARFCEQNYRPDGSIASRRIFQFDLAASPGQSN